MSMVIDPASHYQPQTTFPEVTFLLKGIPPPSNLYVGREDKLVITSFNSAAGFSIDVHARVLLPSGVVVPVLRNHVPNTNRTQATTVIDLAEGFLLNVVAVASAGSAKRGQCYVVVTLGRGDSTARIDHQVILQGYVGSSVNQAWPGNRLENPTEGPGFIRNIVGTAPAAVAEVNESVPTGARWRLLTLFTRLTTSAVVANRAVALKFHNSNGDALYVPAFVNEPASQAYLYSWGGGTQPFSPVVAGTYLNVLPVTLLLAAGGSFLTSTTALDVGDQYTAPLYTVEEWIEP